MQSTFLSHTFFGQIETSSNCEDIISTATLTTGKQKIAKIDGEMFCAFNEAKLSTPGFEPDYAEVVKSTHEIWHYNSICECVLETIIFLHLLQRLDQTRIKIKIHPVRGSNPRPMD